MVCYIERHPDIDVVHGHRKMIDAAGNHLGETSLSPERESAVQYLVARSRFIRQTFLTGVFFSRSAYERIGGYPQFATGMASDDALIFALSVQHDLYFNGKALSSIRLHAEAESYGHEDVFRHFQAFEQFGRYVEYKASREDRFTARDLKSVKSAFTRYARPTISELWLRRVHHCLKREKLSRIPELEDLYAIAVSGRYPFSLRVRLSGFAARKAGYCPEKNLFYRTLWYIWFICYKCLFRIMPQCIAI
jgi:hypothetical protein